MRGLLYFVAVLADWREQEHCQGVVTQILRLQAIGTLSLPSFIWEFGFRVTRSIGKCRMSLWSALVVSPEPVTSFVSGNVAGCF